MKIIQFKAENIKRIEAVEITPDPNSNLIAITGKNKAGKTTVLDCIWWVLAGTKNVQDRPIREGQDMGRIMLNIGKYVINRYFRWSKDRKKVTTKLTVANTDGVRFMSPQGMLDKLLAPLSFDPLAFIRKKPSEQVKALAAVVGIDMDSFTKAQKSDYRERTGYNRTATQKRNAAKAIQFPEETPEEPISIKGLINTLQEAERFNRRVDEEIRQRNEDLDDLQKRRQEAERDLEEVKKVRAQADTQEAKANAALEAITLIEKQVRLREIADHRDTQEIQSQISEAETINQAVAEKHKQKELHGEADEAERESKLLTERMKLREKKQLEQVAQADLPVDGLGFGDGVVTLNGFPLDQASDAEQLAVACGIAMSGNPKLRVIRIRDGSLLDSMSLLHLRKLAEKRDFQVWIEIVEETGNMGVFIQEGKVARVN